MELKFRQLRADEIDCRVAQIRQNGLSLLLYKDARCDMNILDETVGPMNWQRTHCRDNANCVVGIWDEDKKQWIDKEDTGTESNTEALKGLASDSFKRACFNWGIGRELYTAPFIWVPADKCNIERKENSPKPVCYDRFSVMSIEYANGRISGLTIWNTTKNCMAFDMTAKKAPEPKKAETNVDLFIKEEKGQKYAICAKCGGYIYDAKKKDGTILPVRDFVLAGLKEFGEPRCKNCLR